jgi:hypothetical protein
MRQLLGHTGYNNYFPLQTFIYTGLWYQDILSTLVQVRTYEVRKERHGLYPVEAAEKSPVMTMDATKTMDRDRQ